MARNDPFLPDHESVSDGESVEFDGSSGETGSAIVSGLYGDFDAELYIESSTDDGSSWEEIVQLTDDEGETSFSSPWHSQFNRLMISDGIRRIRVDNVDSESGYVAIDGDER